MRTINAGDVQRTVFRVVQAVEAAVPHSARMTANSDVELARSVMTFAHMEAWPAALESLQQLVIRRQHESQETEVGKFVSQEMTYASAALRLLMEQERQIAESERQIDDEAGDR